MKLSAIACIGATVNARERFQEEAEWTEWTSWSSCSRTCGDGTRTRLRACKDSNGDSNGCPGSGVETDSLCNDGQCPTWSAWSDWSECSAECGGGTQSRSRQCQNGESCAGSSDDEQQCNQESCGDVMVIWYESFGARSAGWQHPRQVNYPYVPLDQPYETFFDNCVRYCNDVPGCIAFQVAGSDYFDDRQDSYYCKIITEKLTAVNVPYNKVYGEPYNYRVIGTFGVTQDYYNANKDFFPSEPEGEYQTAVAQIDGLCDQTETGFGLVKYKNTENYKFSPYGDKYIIQAPNSSSNCAGQCFETAGCNAFFVDENDGCTFVIGRADAIKNGDATDSGMLHNSCRTTAFRNTFTLVSQFYCYFRAPSEAEIVDSILEANTGNKDTPLRTWLFETQTLQGSLITSSQFVNVEMPDMTGSVEFVAVRFSIETHVRVAATLAETEYEGSGSEPTERKRKSADDEILAAIASIQRQATSFILDGGLELPDNVEVAATSPVETIAFVQTTADGSVASDCSSGSCQCSEGFIDNGNGCEEMTEEQAATTAAPQVTTQEAEGISISVRDWLPSLIDKMESVCEENRPGKSRPHILKKWRRLSSQMIQRYDRIVFSTDCVFPDTHQDEYLDDFNPKLTCQAIQQIHDSFNAWSQVFTNDCEKEKRGKSMNFHLRNSKRIGQVRDRTRNRLGCIRLI